jgi:hypothetical protein
MLGALGAGFDDADDAAHDGNLFEGSDPALGRSRNLVKLYFVVLASDRGYVDVFAREHHAFDDGLSAVNAFWLLRQRVVTILEY